MEYRYLGNSGLKVSELCLGTWTFGHDKSIRSIGYDMAKPIIDHAIDNGINFFDTADVYSNGESEIILGKAISSFKRENLIISTKLRFLASYPKRDVILSGLSRKQVIERCDASLKRLGTDYIDVYMLHGFDRNTPLEETLRALNDLVRQGKIRYIGCSNFSAWQVVKGLWISDKQNLEKFVTLELYYSLAAREIEFEMVPLCLDQGMGIMVWSPLGGGFFSGKYHKGQPRPKDSRREDVNNPVMQGLPIDEEKGFDIIDKLEKIAKNHNKTVAQTAINYILHKQAVSSVIIGVRKSEQLEDNLGSVGWTMTKEEIQELDEISMPAIIYPYWHQRLTENQ